jgi:hypothetical protein
MRVIRTAIGATTIKPKLLSYAERLQYEGYLRRKQTNAAIMALTRDAVPFKETVRRQEASPPLRRGSRFLTLDLIRRGSQRLEQ